MKRSGDSTHHCRSPTQTLNGCELTPSTGTQSSEQECRYLTASNRHPSTPYYHNIKKPKPHSIALTVASLDNHLVLHARCNCRPFVFIVFWCIARQADRNGETVKHFHNCIKVLSQFRIPYYPNLRQDSKRLKRCAWLCTDTKFRIFASNFCDRKLCRQPSVAIAACRKTCLSQIVLLQYQAKPYLDFQNLGWHCKILGCHFDT